MDLGVNFSRTPCILVADDDWLNCDLLQVQLSSAGCEVVITRNGEQAWESALAHPPDLVIADIQMPILDGLSLCQRLKTHPNTHLVPVLIVTALDAEEEKIKAIEAGADDFISKPYNSLILLSRVRSLLHLKRTHDELESRNLLLRQVLNRYMDRDITEAILTDPTRFLKLGGENRLVTILFADLRGFTRFTEVHPAAQVVDVLNLVFSHLIEAVHQNGGTFDKFLGDAIMAFYGAPLAAPDDARRALRTALEMQSIFSNLKANPSHRILSTLDLGIGVHSGEAVVGNIGTERIMNYTVVGDAVNVAKRLQEGAQPGEILISATTYRQVPQARIINPLVYCLPGRKDPVMVYTLEDLVE